MRKRNYQQIIFSLILFVFNAQSALADMFHPSHSCREPYKPFSFTSRFELDMYFDEVEQYKDCLVEFIDDQEESIKKHRLATEDAANDWNSFKNRELR